MLLDESDHTSSTGRSRGAPIAPPTGTSDYSENLIDSAINLTRGSARSDTILA